MKQIKKKSKKALQRSIIKSSRNMAKGVEGRMWCKNKSGKMRPITKNIFKMVILTSYKDMSSFKFQAPISRNCLSIQEIKVVLLDQVSFIGFTAVRGNRGECFPNTSL